MPKFSFKKRFQSFPFALNGIRILIQETHNAWVHLFTVIIFIILGFVLEISIGEWMILSILIGLVFALEAVNSAIEILCDFVFPEKHNQIKKIKDLAVMTSSIIGILIFLPKLF